MSDSPGAAIQEKVKGSVGKGCCTKPLLPPSVSLSRLRTRAGSSFNIPHHAVSKATICKNTTHLSGHRCIILLRCRWFLVVGECAETEGVRCCWSSREIQIYFIWPPNQPNKQINEAERWCLHCRVLVCFCVCYISPCNRNPPAQTNTQTGEQTSRLDKSKRGLEELRSSASCHLSGVLCETQEWFTINENWPSSCITFLLELTC